MDKSLAAKLTTGIRSLQSLLGETTVINTVTYPCIVGMESVHQPLMEGGFKSTAHATLSIALQDILCSPTPPAIGDIALLVERNRSYRIETITPTQTTFEYELQDVTA